MSQATETAHQAPTHLYALMLKLRARAAGDLLPNAGQLAHAALLHWLGQVDPALAAHLHEPNAERPFTCSSLWFPNERAALAAQRTNRRLPILPAQTYWLRLTLLTDLLFRTLTARFFHPIAATTPIAPVHVPTGEPSRGRRQTPTTAPPRHTASDVGSEGLGLPTLRLGGVIFDIAELIALPGEPTGPAGPVGSADGASAWAGYATYDGLVKCARALDPITDPAVRTVGLEFRSPTAFSDGQTAWGKRMHLFPDPERVFDRLARAWNRWAPDVLALDVDAVQAYARDWVAPAHYDLRTHTFHFDRHAQVGFAGHCIYRLMDVELPPARHAALAALAALAARAQSATPPGPMEPLVGRPRRGEEPPPPASVGAGLTPAQALHLLAAFSFYCGIGQKTTMGMGQARPLPLARSASDSPTAGPPAAIPKHT